MVTTVCLNPAIDQSAYAERLKIGEVNRLSDTRTVIGGKGINVAIILGRLRAEARCISCVGEADTQLFSLSMEREAVPLECIAVPGSVRRNLKVVETHSRSVTELNGQGAAVNEAALERVMTALDAQATNSRYIALCGSLPPECGPGTYAALMRRMPQMRWIVDSSGAALSQALAAKPYLIKPNLPELEELTQTRLETLEAIQHAAAGLCRTGIGYAAVSLGAGGALITDGRRTVYAPALKVMAVSTVGAGDAMLAGLLYGLGRNETVFDSLRFGIAAGAACVQGGSIHAFDASVFAALVPNVAVRDI